MTHVIYGNTSEGGIIHCETQPIRISANPIMFPEYGEGNKSGTIVYILGISTEGELLELDINNINSSGSNGKLITKFLHNGNTSSSTWLKHEFEGNNTSNNGPWIIPFEGTITNVYAQGRNTANNKNLDIYINGVVEHSQDLSGLNYISYTINEEVFEGDEISIRIEDVGDGGGWDDPIMWLTLE